MEDFVSNLKLASGEYTIHDKYTYENVKRYGAKGNGVDDDFNAFKTAFESVPDGGSIIVPDGVYLLSANPVTDSKKSITWLFDNNVKLIGAGVDRPDAPIYQGKLQSPLTNTGNRVAGIKASYHMENAISPMGNGVVAECREWIADSSNDYITVTGTIETGSSQLSVSSVEGIELGYGILLTTPSRPEWLSGDSRTNTVRVIGINRNTKTLTIGTPVAGAGYGTEWNYTGTAIHNGTFVIRKRKWNVVSFIGTTTGKQTNIDRYAYCENMVMDIEENAGLMLELDMNFVGNCSDIARGIYISGGGDKFVNGRAIDIERGRGSNWDTGIRIRSCDNGLHVNGNHAINIDTDFWNGYSWQSQPFAAGITFSNLTAVNKNHGHLLGGKQLQNGLNCIVLERTVDANTAGNYLDFKTSDGNTSVFNVGTNGIMYAQAVKVNQLVNPNTALTLKGHINILDGNGNVVKLMVAN